ncbi:MAG TPA: hypothetical protein VFU15_00585 [Bacteroidia bacterium]|nr:hypothetical protein [Bacteroidia bacterium]
MKKRVQLFFEAGHHNSRSVWPVLFGVILGLTCLRQHLVSNYNCELCADKAGYYMYLPASFGMGFHADAYPGNFDHDHGDGFHLDRQSNRVVTKFTCGVAILDAPFYALGAIAGRIFSPGTSPYSYFYLFFINIGAAFYVTAGMYFLRRWLDHYTGRITSFLAVLAVFAGTNLYYYTLDESLMSHVYSFALFCFVLYAMKEYTLSHSFSHFIFFSVSLSLAILIRPTNFLFGIFALLTDVKNPGDLKRKFSLFISFRNITAFLVIFFLVMLPQVIYWKFAFGKYVVWSYEGEGFTNWNDPAFLTVWFSPQSGLFTYTPLLLVPLVFAVYMVRKKIPNGVLVLAAFFIVSYLCASWHNPFFGVCNFGKRPFVEYLPLLMFPLALLFERFGSLPKFRRNIVLVSVLFFIYYNQALFAAFNTCFPGSEWDWREFFHFLGRALPLIR